MSTQTRVSHPIYNLLPTEVEGFDSLAELALDMRWSWNHATDGVWRQLDPELWDLTQNPWVVLQTVSRDQLERVLADPGFRKNIDDLLQAKHQAAEAPAWFQQHHPQAPLSCVAYFSLEFMLSEALPIYSGGLGNVAGDQLKAASDLGVPVVGVGLLYQRGYFRQVIDKDGAQQALFPYNDPGQLPITPLRQPNGEWLRLEIALPGYSVWLRAWQVQVGRVKLFLLDSNDAANFPAHRGITSELYGGGPELRLKQEMLLGIGGWRLLAALGIKPEVCHLSHYDMQLTERLVQGVDVWLNTPRRPWEACGTSGMKVLVNGGINLSELDGWWAEAYAPEVGWALGDGQEHGEDPAWDAADAVALYERLEREVIPEFYARNEQGIPTAWVGRMRESMARLTPRFSANRAVCEYTEQRYLPAASAYHSRAADKGASGRRMVEWRHSLDQKWAGLRFGELKIETRGDQHTVNVQVYLGDLDPEAVRIEIFADGASDVGPVRQEMTPGQPLAGAAGGYGYSGSVSAVRPASDYAARAVPQCEGVAVPLEAGHILWQR